MNEIEKFTTELKLKGFSEKTLKNYLFFIEKFMLHANKPVPDLNEDDIKSYLSSLLDSKSRATVSLAASALRSFYTVLEKPISKIQLPKKEKKLPIVLNKEEVKKLISASQTAKSKLIISFLYSSGLRVSELVNLKPVDLNLDEKTGWVRKGKGSKDRIFILSENLMLDLKNYLQQNKENQYLFSASKPLTTRNIQKIIQLTSAKAGINKRVTPHTLRHSYATHLLESGVDIRIIQELLGHANLNTTQLYAHVSSEQLKKVKNPLDAI